MTWSTPVHGVRVWNHKTFVEPSDEELAEYGWTRGYSPAVERRDHTCADCPKVIHRQSTRCWDCSTAHRRRAAAEQGERHACLDCPTRIAPQSVRCQPCNARWMTAQRTEAFARVDEMVVDRVLAGDWRLPTNKAEKTAVVERWLAAGGTQNALHRLTGWCIARYVRRDAQDVAA